MRITFLAVLSSLYFQAFPQLAEVDWISPTPHGYVFIEIANAPSSGYYAIAQGGYFCKLDNNFKIVYPF